MEDGLNMQTPNTLPSSTADFSSSTIPSDWYQFLTTFPFTLMMISFPKWEKGPFLKSPKKSANEKSPLKTTWFCVVLLSSTVESSHQLISCGLWGCIPFHWTSLQKKNTFHYTWNGQLNIYTFLFFRQHTCEDTVPQIKLFKIFRDRKY